VTNPKRTVFSIKRLIGRAGPEIDAEAALLPYPVHQGERGLARVRIGDQDWSPEQVSALILRADHGRKRIRRQLSVDKRAYQNRWTTQ